MYPAIATSLAFLAIVAVALALGLTLALSISTARARLVAALVGQDRHPLAWAAGVAFIATASSLYFSEVVHLTPCTLCWYQRIAMYPLVPVLAVGLIRADGGVWRYALPLPVVGLLISTYHVTIQWRPSLDLGTCTTGAPCTGRYLAVFGFVSIPTMAGGAFLLIIALLLLVRALGRVP